MPELPEVETVRLALERTVLGETLTRIPYYRPDFVRCGIHHLRDFSAAVLEQAERRGKFLVLHLSNRSSLMVHLGMSGRLLIKTPPTEPEPHTHICIQINGGECELHQRDPRRFGFFAYFMPGELERYPSWNRLGIEPFDLRPKLLFTLLQQSSRPIKSFLLDQTKIAGLGNIYVDESLHRAPLHPMKNTQSLTLTEARALCSMIKKVLREAIKNGGTSTNDYRRLDGTFGSFQDWLRVYQQEGKPCTTCGDIIQKISASGRGTHFCPTCQRL